MIQLRLISLAVLVIGVTASQGFAHTSPDPYNPTPPKILNYQEYVNEIIYPMTCREYGIEGRVVIQIEVNQQGEILDYQVLKSAHELLTEACLKKIEMLRFSKESIGTSASSKVVVPIKFSLRI